MFVKKKPVDDTKLTFPPMGAKKSVLQRVSKPDVENAADAKKPGDAAEDAKDSKKTKKAPAKANKFAAKAAAALAARK
jgi:hypothetical protein